VPTADGSSMSGLPGGAIPSGLKRSTTRSAAGRLIGRSRSLSGIRRKLGFVEAEDFDDLVAPVHEFDDGEAWVPLREVLNRWRRNGGGPARPSLVDDQADHRARPRRV
jgi:hypothetical protein